MEWPDFETKLARIGRKGLRLSGAADEFAPEEALVFRNVRARLGGPLQPRPGYTELGSGAGAVDVHSIIRIDDPARGDWTRYFGAGTTLWAGRDSATGFTNLTALFETALSGSPLTFLAYRSALTGEPWLIIVDETGPYKVRKVGSEWQAQILGLEPPPVKCNAAISDLLTTRICAFDTSDSTEATNWTATAGYDFSETPIGVATAPTIVDGPGLSGDTIEVTFNKGSAQTGYYSWIGTSLDVDLTTLQGGAHQAYDDDYIHLWIKASNPAYVEEIRIYFVCSQGFDPAVVPGTSDITNTDAFVKSIRPHDFQDYVDVSEDALAAGLRARNRQEVEDYLARGGNNPGPPTVPVVDGPADMLDYIQPSVPDDPTGTYSQPVISGSLPTTTTQQLYPGSGVWSEFGAMGRPLRRRDFTRIGRTEDVGWANITGVIIAVVTTEAQDVTLSFDDWFLTGGYGPDAGPAEAIPYDYRYTHYDVRTGAESNPSPIFEDDDRLQPMRQRISLSGTPWGGVNSPYIRQRFYRRGGLLPDNWRFVGQSESDGGEVVDTATDVLTQAAGILELDNFRPVESVDLDGNATRSNVTAIFGPIDGVLVALGDKYRPGHVNWSKVENPDAWPLENEWEVCAASEQLMNGCIYGTAGFVFSRKRLYALVPDGQGGLVSQSTECVPGLTAKMGMCVTPFGIAYVALDGVRLTQGGQSKVLSWQIDPLFRGETVESMAPIDLTNEDAIQLQSVGTELRFFYEDADGTRCCLVYDFVDDQWAQYDYAQEMATCHYETVTGSCILGGVGVGAAYTEGGTDDNGTAIACRIKTGYWDMGDARRDKLLGDVVIDADIPTGTDLLLTTFINNDIAVNPQLTKHGLDGRRRFQFDPFGEQPQRCRNIALDLQWSSRVLPKLWFAGISVVLEPDMTLMRATTWESLGPDGGAGYLTGCTITADTNGVAKRFLVEVGDGQVRTSAATITVLAPARRRLHFSWPYVKADQIRLRPLDPCDAIMLYKVEWHVQPEPPKITAWDSNQEEKFDTYYTGLDLVIDTQGLTKTIDVYVDQALVATRTVSANGKRVVHLSFGPGRGHVYQFVSRDTNPGRLYTWRWHLQEEPSEQTNWNQNYTVGGHLSDKWVKGVLLECDTFGEDKTIEVQIDGTTVETFTVNTDGRTVVHQALTGQYKGRVLRLLPTDSNPGRLYTLQWIFDLEPLALTRWETQELDFGLGRWFLPLSALITVRAPADVTLTLTCYGERGTVLNTSSYTITATGTSKVQDFVGFNAAKAAMIKLVATSSQPFALYRDESSIRLLPWGAPSDLVRPIGNDDLDPARPMGNATVAAATPGGA